MVAEVKILVQGETNVDQVAETGEEHTRPTITLVRDGDIIMVVDPGILESQQILTDALGREGLRIEDINVVCITHSHIDHYRNIGMFPKAKTLEFYGLWNKESVESWPEQFSPHIQVLRTPGHDYTGITLLVSTSEGVIAICGDVFWKENFPDEATDDLYASDPKKLEESRKLVIKISDWIIPGHAGIYKVQKDIAIKKILNGKKTKKSKFIIVCKTCKRSIEKQQDICICRPWLCFRDCECGIDCNTCNCYHKKQK